MMKRLTLLLGGWLVWVLLMTIPAYADGGPHRSHAASGAPTSGSCATCHRAHTAQAPDLLKDTQPQLCYACHGDTGQGAKTDVEGGVDNSSTSSTFGRALRGGGFAYALISPLVKASTVDSTLPYATGWAADPATAALGGGTIALLTTATRQTATSFHTIDGTSVTMWGNGALGSGPGTTVSLYCTSCHDPHGNGNYRILRPIPNGSGAATGVTIADTSTHTYTTTNYWNVNYTDNAAVDVNISAWCSTCHTRYLADSTAAATSSTDSTFKYRHQTNTTAAYTPICIQCHVAHGSNLTETSGAATVRLPGAASDPASNPSDSRLLRLPDRYICQMCHLR